LFFALFQYFILRLLVFGQERLDILSGEQRTPLLWPQSKSESYRAQSMDKRQYLDDESELVDVPKPVFDNFLEILRIYFPNAAGQFSIQR
jgi:hypothetical protein